MQPFGTTDDRSENLLIIPIQEQRETEPEFSSNRESIVEPMNVRSEHASSGSTRTSMSSIHDIHLDPNELALRLARLDSQDTSSPPKKTLADELAELGERQSQFFETDSLNQSPRRKIAEPPPTDNLAAIISDIHQIIQEKSVSSLENIVGDILAKTNNRNLTKIVDYHQSPPISNLQTIMREIHQTPLGKPTKRPPRPTHLSLDVDDETLSTPGSFDDELETYKLSTPSPILSKPKSDSIATTQATRYVTQRIEKVSDLEIVKQGKGFKIGYVDRQGTDQRVILTKRIEAGPDIIARDPHIRLPYKGRKILNQFCSSVLHTNGYNTIQEDRKFQRHADQIEIPIIGTNPAHFDEVCI